MLNDPHFRALLREGGLSAGLVGRGATSLGSASVGNTAIYTQAFFDLSIGLERLCKLIIVLDKLIKANAFPSDAEMRTLGHDLESLLQEVRRVAALLTGLHWTIPSDTITNAAIGVLSEFAKATRYYNLDLLVAGRSVSTGDPIARWYSEVGSKIIAKHYGARARAKAAAEVAWVATYVDPISMTRSIAEDGAVLTSASAQFARVKESHVVQRHGRTYMLTLVRGLAEVLRHLQYEAQRAGHPVPYFSELFAIFNNEDSYFLKRKTWDPARP